MLDQQEKKVILKRLRYVEGQIRGIQKMIENDRALPQIFTQLKAMEQGIHKVIHVVFEEQLKKHLAEVLSKRLAACPGNCSDAERLQYTRQQFAMLDLKGVIQSISWLTGKEADIPTIQMNKRRVKT